MRTNKILILTATPTEAELIRGWAHASILGCEAVWVACIGVGPYRAAFHTQRLVAERQPDLVILAGVAGSYLPDRAAVGDAFLIARERAADVGSFMGTHDASFTPKFSETIDCPHLPACTTLPTATSNSLSAAGAPFVAREGVLLENMEGVAFFYVCRALGLPFLELRVVSNVVGEPFERWDLPLALENLSKSLKKLLHELIA